MPNVQSDDHSVRVLKIGVRSTVRLFTVLSVVMTTAILVATGLLYLVLEWWGIIAAVKNPIQMFGYWRGLSWIQVVMGALALYGLNFIIAIVTAIWVTMVINLSLTVTNGFVVQACRVEQES